MLTGRMDPDDAPPGYAPVAELLAAASSPPDASELAGESSVVAAFAAAARSHPCAPLGRRHPRRRPRGWPGRSRLHLRAALAGAMLGVLAVSAVAAATGELPASAQQVAHRMLGRAGVPAPGAAAKGRAHAATSTSQPTTRAATGGNPGTTDEQRQSPSTAQNTERTRMLNLCRAWTDWSDHLWRHGQPGGTNNGGSAGSDGNWRHFSYNDLVTLSKAAGGVWRISAWCRHLAQDGAAAGPSSPEPGPQHGNGNGNDGNPSPGMAGRNDMP